MSNFTYPTNISTPLDIMSYMNDTTGNWAGLLILLAIFFMLFLTFYFKGGFSDESAVKKSLLMSSFLSFVFTLLFIFMGLADWRPLILFTIAFVGSLAWSFAKS